jgi:hypothetical protein
MSNNETELNTNKRVPDFTPNEVVGYRITPEANSWTVSLVKRKATGDEYKTPMSYHKNISSSVCWIFNNVSQLEGKRLQKEYSELEGEIANQDVLLKAFDKGLKSALEAVDALEKDLVEAGIPLKGLASNLSKIIKTEVMMEEELTQD